MTIFQAQLFLIKIIISLAFPMLDHQKVNKNLCPLLSHIQFCYSVLNVHSSKKVTQHDFDRLYFYYLGFLFIKLDIPRKLDCLFAFPLMPYLLGLFHWGAWRVSKLRAIPKIKTCKIDRIVWEMKVCAFPFVAEFMCGYPLPIHCAEVSDSFGVMNGQWVRVHTTQTLGITCISHTDWSILQLFDLDFTPNLLSLHAPQ